MAKETTLRIPAIHCEGCVKTVSRTLGALPNVVVIQADPVTKLVRLRFDESVVGLNRILEALDEVGFSADSASESSGGSE